MLAVGAMPRKLAIHSNLQQEVLHLRSLEDAKRLAMETIGKSVAIIGSGLLGKFSTVETWKQGIQLDRRGIGINAASECKKCQPLWEVCLVVGNFW